MDAEETTETGKPQLLRPTEGRWIAGVAVCLSRRFRIPVWIVRTLFVLLTLPLLTGLLLFDLLAGTEDRFSWLTFPAMLAMFPFGVLIPVGWGAVLYLMGWMMIPREDATFLGRKERTALLSYPAKALIYLTVSLIATWVGSRYYYAKYNYTPGDLIFLFASVFWPSLLVLAAARFRILGTIISSIVGFGLVVLLWVGYTTVEDSTSLMGLLGFNTVTMPPALLVIGLREWGSSETRGE